MSKSLINKGSNHLVNGDTSMHDVDKLVVSSSGGRQAMIDKLRDTADYLENNPTAELSAQLSVIDGDEVSLSILNTYMESHISRELISYTATGCKEPNRLHQELTFANCDTVLFNGITSVIHSAAGNAPIMNIRTASGVVYHNLRNGENNE